jgi:hypothetical protein
MNETSSFLNEIDNKSLWRKFTSLNDIESNQNKHFYIKAGEKNKEIVNEAIQTYDLNHSILSTLRPYFLTNKLQYIIENYYTEREIFLTKMLEKYLSIN